LNIESIESLQTLLSASSYISDRGLSTATFLALKLNRPLFLEGEPGVGKTEVAKVLANVLQTDLIRLQCYEGLDIHHAVYEWNYSRQMLHIHMLESRGEKATEAELFGPEFLLQRPLLKAIDYAGNNPPVLLIDEIDRSDEEFEAYLLELLSDFQITIPEIGTLKAEIPPVVIITSNRTREVHDAIKRRCIYHWIEYPTFEKELAILALKVPHAPKQLSQQVTAFIQELRHEDLYKVPGVAESLDWVEALAALDHQGLNRDVVEQTLGVVLKYEDDIRQLQEKQIDAILEKVAGRI
jgi:MoxR-like ATPase